jgi:hypothetical protein
MHHTPLTMRGQILATNKSKDQDNLRYNFLLLGGMLLPFDLREESEHRFCKYLNKSKQFYAKFLTECFQDEN